MSEATDITAVDQADERGKRKVRVGKVVSEKMNKTVVVAVQRLVKHPRYKKYIKRTSKLHAHDETNDAHEGDTVRIVETKPLSKLKRWRVQSVIERAK
jgi:small subunit ribosomal protein S17